MQLHAYISFVVTSSGARTAFTRPHALQCPALQATARAADAAGVQHARCSAAARPAALPTAPPAVSGLKGFPTFDWRFVLQTPPSQARVAVRSVLLRRLLRPLSLAAREEPAQHVPEVAFHLREAAAGVGPVRRRRRRRFWRALLARGGVGGFLALGSNWRSSGACMRSPSGAAGNWRRGAPGLHHRCGNSSRGCQARRLAA